MSDSSEQAQLRAHLAELRSATRGLSHDFNLEFQDLGNKIDRLGTLTAREARHFKEDIQYDFGRLGRRIDAEVRSFPGDVRSVGEAIGTGTVRAVTAAGGALEYAGHRAKEGTKNALATAAGVRRTPMREWRFPEDDDSVSSGGD